MPTGLEWQQIKCDSFLEPLKYVWQGVVVKHTSLQHEKAGGSQKAAFDWQNVKRFNFTYALLDGAWLEDGNERREWFGFSEIVAKMGRLWLDAQHRKQGWMTGCWIDVAEVREGAAK